MAHKSSDQSLRKRVLPRLQYPGLERRGNKSGPLDSPLLPVAGLVPVSRAVTSVRRGHGLLTRLPEYKDEGSQILDLEWLANRPGIVVGRYSVCMVIMHSCGQGSGHVTSYHPGSSTVRTLDCLHRRMARRRMPGYCRVPASINRHSTPLCSEHAAQWQLHRSDRTQ